MTPHVTAEPQVADRIRGLPIVLHVEQQDAGVTFKCRLSSLLHPSDSLDDGWMRGAFSELHVHECKKMCVNVCGMQMWSSSRVVQSGCTRRAMAEHSAEIIHQLSKTNSLTTGSRKAEQIHSWRCVCTKLWIHPQHITQVSPIDTKAHLQCLHWSHLVSVGMQSSIFLLLPNVDYYWSRGVIKQFANCLFSNNTK